MRIWRAANPLEAAFNNLKRSAGKRGIGFELTLDEFRQWCKETNYLELKGEFHCDRERCLEPYKIGNIRLLPSFENLSKSYAERKIHAGRGTGVLFA